MNGIKKWWLRRKVLNSLVIGDKYTVSEIAKGFGFSDYLGYDWFYTEILEPLADARRLIIDKRNTYTIERVK